MNPIIKKLLELKQFYTHDISNPYNVFQIDCLIDIIESDSIWDDEADKLENNSKTLEDIKKLINNQKGKK